MKMPHMEQSAEEFQVESALIARRHPSTGGVSQRSPTTHVCHVMCALTAKKLRVPLLMRPKHYFNTLPHSGQTPHSATNNCVLPLTLKEGSIASARRYASSAASGSPSCPRHSPIMFQSVLESTFDFTTSLKSKTARLKYRSCARVSVGVGVGAGGAGKASKPFRQRKHKKARQAPVR